MLSDMTERPKQIAVRFSDEERQMLLALAKANGISASDIVRQLVRKAFRELSLETKHALT